MERERRKRERQRLKDIDMEIIRAAMVLHSLLQDRAARDYVGTKTLIDGIVDTLQVVPLGSEGEVP